MSGNRSLFGVRAIAYFYVVGTVAVLIAFFGNRDEVGRQLALVHGLSGQATAAAFAATVVLGVLVAVGLLSGRRWGFWLTLAYMAYLLVVPPLTVGASRVPVFSNVLWPLFVAAYLVWRRRAFVIGGPRSV